MTTPEAACGRLPLEGATPAARQSRFRGVCLTRVRTGEALAKTKR
jgi:hypothetical protein